MAVVIRRSKPVVIKRRPKPILRRPEDIGSGWPGRPGHPYHPGQPYYHLLTIDGVDHVFLWEPGAPLDCQWSCGLYRCSPGVMARHDYRGVCYPVLRSNPEPQEDIRYVRSR